MTPGNSLGVIAYVPTGSHYVRIELGWPRAKYRVSARRRPLLTLDCRTVNGRSKKVNPAKHRPTTGREGPGEFLFVPPQSGRQLGGSVRPGRRGGRSHCTERTMHVALSCSVPVGPYIDIRCSESRAWEAVSGVNCEVAASNGRCQVTCAAE